MIKELKIKEKNIIYTEVSENLHKKDIEKMQPLIHTIIEKGLKIRWYFEMTNFEGWDLEGFWEDIKMDASHTDDYEKIAMVGDKKWEELLSKSMKPLTNAKVKFFELSKKEEAWAWIRK